MGHGALDLTKRSAGKRANRVALALLALTLLAAFTPIAYTDIPDQTWLGGLWDGADWDEAILQFESTGATVQAVPVRSTEPVLVVLSSTTPRREMTPVSVAISPSDPRAPPAL